MSKSVSIDIDGKSSNFVLCGDTETMLRNARLLISLKRLKYELSDGKILIPFDATTKIRILKEIQTLLEKFLIKPLLAENAKSEVASFIREQETFQHFAKNAKDIRNDCFSSQPELVSGFDAFQKTVAKRVVRPLYPLQLLSAFHMAFSQNACNFAVPGAGKTSIVYAAYSYLKSLSKDDVKHVDKLLVIGPLASFAPWEKEYEACFGEKPATQRLSGDYTISRDLKEQHLYSANPAEVTLIWHGGVDSLKNEILEFLAKHKTMVVVDEAHRIKNPDGEWGRSAVEIAKEAKSRIILTGTPVPNGYEDLYNLFQFLYPFKFKEILGVHRVNLESMTKNANPDDEQVKEFTSSISPYFIRIKKADLGLPEAVEQQVKIEMDTAQREIYDFIESKYIDAFQQDSSANVKDLLNRARLIRLRQAATNPSLLLKPIADAFDKEDESIGFLREALPEEFQNDSFIVTKIRNYANSHTPNKFIEIKNLFEKQVSPENGKLIVWSIFIQNAKQLQRYLTENDIASRLLIGEIGQADREIIIDAFNDPENSDFQVVIANPFAVSESISLHKGCHNAAYLERDYNCATFLQSKDRIHRYGLPKSQITRYFFLISTDSIDEVIDQRLMEKVKRMEKIIDEDIPLFARINDSDETDLIKALLIEYAKRA